MPEYKKQDQKSQRVVFTVAGLLIVIYDIQFVHIFKGLLSIVRVK